MDNFDCATFSFKIKGCMISGLPCKKDDCLYYGDCSACVHELGVEYCSNCSRLDYDRALDFGIYDD